MQLGLAAAMNQTDKPFYIFLICSLSSGREEIIVKAFLKI